MILKNVNATALAMVICSSSGFAADDIIMNCNTNAPEYIACSKDATCTWNVCFRQSNERQSTVRNISIYGGYGFPGTSFIEDENTSIEENLNNQENDFVRSLTDTRLGEVGISTEISSLALWLQYRWRDQDGTGKRELSRGGIFDRSGADRFLLEEQYELELGIQPQISLSEALSYIWPNDIPARNDGSFVNFQFAYKNTDYRSDGDEFRNEEITNLEKFRFTLGTDNFFDFNPASVAALSLSPSLGIEAEISANYDRIDRQDFPQGSDEGLGWGWRLSPYLEVGINDVTDLRLYYEYDWSETAKLQPLTDSDDPPEAAGTREYRINETNEFVGVRVSFNISNLIDKW